MLYFVVEHDNRIICVCVGFFRNLKLKNFRIKKESKSRFENWRNRFNKEHSLQTFSSFLLFNLSISLNSYFLIFWTFTKSIQWVLNICIRESLFYLLKISLISKWEMIYNKWLIYCVAFILHLPQNILEVHSSNIKIARHSIQLHISFKSTPLFVSELY